MVRQTQPKLRKCPICGQVSNRSFCPDDKISTLLVHPPEINAGAVRPGTIIADRYLIEAKIGRGGFGSVFRAQHTGTGQQVALKCLDTSAGLDEIQLKRFFQEARVTAGLKHPNTIRVFDFGQDDSGLLYIAMELLEGRSLKQELSARKRAGEVFTQNEAIDIGTGILKSLTEAHAAGLVHRDLKPDNVFLHQVPGEKAIVKVLDFGIVKLNDSTITQDSNSGTPGTPAYMSPEQISRNDVEATSDLYSVGVLLYQLIAGRVPLRGETAMQTMYRHVHDQPLPLKTRTQTPITEMFATLVHVALAKQPSERPRDAATMRAQLERCRGAAANLAPQTPTAAIVHRGTEPTTNQRGERFFDASEKDISFIDASVAELPPPPSSRWLYVTLAAGLFAFGVVIALWFLGRSPPVVPIRTTGSVPAAVAPTPIAPKPIRSPEKPIVDAPKPVVAPVVEDVKEVAKPPVRRRVIKRNRTKKRKTKTNDSEGDILDEKI